MKEYIFEDKESIQLDVGDGFRVWRNEEYPLNRLVASFHDKATDTHITELMAISVGSNTVEERGQMSRDYALLSAICRFLNSGGSFAGAEYLLGGLASQLGNCQLTLPVGWSLLDTGLVIDDMYDYDEPTADFASIVARHIFWHSDTGEAVIFCEDQSVELTSIEEVRARFSDPEEGDANGENIA